MRNPLAACGLAKRAKPQAADLSTNQGHRHTHALALAHQVHMDAIADDVVAFDVSLELGLACVEWRAVDAQNDVARLDASIPGLQRDGLTLAESQLLCGQSE